MKNTTSLMRILASVPNGIECCGADGLNTNINDVIKSTVNQAGALFTQYMKERLVILVAR